MKASLGADDFIAKPYNTQILLMHAALSAQIVIIWLEQKLSHATLDSSSRGFLKSSVERQNELGILTMQMWERLFLMYSRGGWQSDSFVDIDNTLTVNISHLRNTLCKRPRVLRTL